VDGFISEEFFFQRWFPILSAFSRVILNSDNDNIQTQTLDLLFESLKTAKHVFSENYWKIIFRSIVLPIFEDLDDSKKDDEDGLRIKTGDVVINKSKNISVWIHCLRLLVDTFSEVFEVICVPDGTLISGILGLTISMLKKKDEKVSF
jgi:brefeldin A-inhibited guanine nucleotide-exchange protein